jgi:hypothetical protein
MSSVRSLEPLVNNCTRIFTNTIHDLVGQTLDLDLWLQWCTFDAIYIMAFSKPADFLEQRRNVSGSSRRYGLDSQVLCSGRASTLASCFAEPVLKAAMKMHLFDMGPLIIVSEMIETALKEYNEAAVKKSTVAGTSTRIFNNKAHRQGQSCRLQNWGTISSITS